MRKRDKDRDGDGESSRSTIKSIFSIVDKKISEEFETFMNTRGRFCCANSKHQLAQQNRPLVFQQIRVLISNRRRLRC